MTPFQPGMGNPMLWVGQGVQQAQALDPAGAGASPSTTPQQRLAAAIMQSGQNSQNAGALGLNLAAEGVAQNSPHLGPQISQALGGLFGLGQQAQAGTDPNAGAYPNPGGWS